MDLNNDFTTGNNLCPKYHPQTLHLLDKYSKTVVPKTSTSKGLSFAQGDASKGKYGRGGDNKRGGYNKTLNKNYLEDKECYKCGEQVYSSSNCINFKKDKYDNDKTTKTNARRAIIKNLANDAEKMTIEFTTVNTKLQQLKEDESNLFN